MDNMLIGLFDFFSGNKPKLKISLPKGIRIERLDDRVKFMGTMTEITRFAREIRKVSKLNDGELARTANYVLKVSNHVTEDRFRKNWIELSPIGWNVMASKFLEVVNRYEENPFYFNSCGYIEKIPFDIGVEVTDFDK